MTEVTQGKMRTTLSEVASRLMKLNEGEGQAYDDLHAFHAPSECGLLIARGIDADRAKVFQETGWSQEEFQEELRKRTTPKWAHFSGLCHGLD